MVLFIAFEGISGLKNRSKSGNIALKIDIKNALFDTINYNFVTEMFFLINVWISVILGLARISFLHNEIPRGFLNFERGVRQGDPLSRLLFVIVEDFLNRYISLLVNSRAISAMSASRGLSFPSHLFFLQTTFLLFVRGLKGI